MTAQDYPITTGYGQIPGYPLNNGFHRGVDRACPTGTILLVNGIEIGKTGNTGASTGAHLHLGRFVNGQPTDPGKEGFKLSDPVCTETGQDSTSGKYIKLKDSNGTIWFYCHLSEILTKAGDKIMNRFDPAQVNLLCAIAFNRQARQDEKETYSTLDATEVLNRIVNGAENTQQRTYASEYPKLKEQYDQLSDPKPLASGVYEVK